MTSRTSAAAAALLTLLLALAAAPAFAQADEDRATVTLVHGIRGLVADVYLNGELALEGFEPERITDPIPVPPGEHEVGIYVSGEGPPDEPALSARVTVEPGQSLSAIAYADEAGLPQALLFENDISQLEPGSARLVVSNVAAGEGISVLLDEEPAGDPLDAGGELAVEVDAGEHEIAALDGVQQDVALEPASVELDEGSVQVLYLIGSVEEGTLAWLTQTITGLGTPPTAVDTGNSGLAAEPPAPVALWALSLLLAATAACVLGARRLARSGA